MSEIIYSCGICNKQCKNKKGLAVHESKCSNIKSRVCSYCNENFSSLSALSRHIDRCKVFLQQKSEQEQRKREESVKNEYEQRLEELELLLYQQKQEKEILTKTSEEEIKKREEEIKKREEEIKHQINLREEEIKTQVKLREEEIKTQVKLRDESIKEIKKKWTDDVNVKVKMREDDLDRVKEKLEIQTSQVLTLQQENAQLKRSNESYIAEIKYDKNMYAEICKKLGDQKPSVVTHHNNINNYKQNFFQLQPLEASMFQGRINPPALNIGSSEGVVDHTCSLGVTNHYRITDKSRGNAVWHKQGVGEIKDPKCVEMTNFIIDSLVDDFQKQKAYWQTKFDEVSGRDPPNPSLVNECRQFINFSERVCRKDPTLMKDIQQLYVERGKYRTDTSVDKISDRTYFNLTTAMVNALFPQITKWIGKTPREVGVYLSQFIENYYIIEGVSKTNLSIVIKDDSNKNQLVHAEKFQPLILKALGEVFEETVSCKTLLDALTNQSTLDQEQVKEWLEYIESPTLEYTQEMVVGLIWRK